MNFNSTACTVGQVSTNTTGFSVTNAQLPLTLGAGASRYLNLTMVLPPNSFDGPLNLIYE